MIKKLGLKLKEQKGFTLIELLAVIVILGIIAAIAIPAIGNIIQKSKNDAKVAEAIQIIDAARLATLEGTGTGIVAASLTAADSAAGVEPIAYKWVGIEADTDKLDPFLSKVQDKTFTVIYNVASKSYSIYGHNSAKVLNTANTDTTEITEDALITEAKN